MDEKFINDKYVDTLEERPDDKPTVVVRDINDEVDLSKEDLRSSRWIVQKEDGKPSRLNTETLLEEVQDQIDGSIDESIEQLPKITKRTARGMNPFPGDGMKGRTYGPMIPFNFNGLGRMKPYSFTPMTGKPSGKPMRGRYPKKREGAGDILHSLSGQPDLVKDYIWDLIMDRVPELRDAEETYNLIQSRIAGYTDPFTPTEKIKLRDIETRATADMTANEIISLLNLLPKGERLNINWFDGELNIPTNTVEWHGQFQLNTAYGSGDMVIDAGNLFIYISDVPATNTVRPAADTTRAEHLDAGSPNDIVDATKSNLTITLVRRSGDNINLEITNSDIVSAFQGMTTTEKARVRTALDVPLVSHTHNGATVWNGIARGTSITVGAITSHGGAYFGCIRNHSKGTTGPDGDSVNWIILSNWGNTWSNKWYPAGTMVERSGSPYVALQNVNRGDPAPDASNNSKWLRMDADPSLFAPANHNHNDIYYTETESDGRFAPVSTISATPANILTGVKGFTDEQDLEARDALNAMENSRDAVINAVDGEQVLSDYLILPDDRNFEVHSAVGGGYLWYGDRRNLSPRGVLNISRVSEDKVVENDIYSIVNAYTSPRTSAPALYGMAFAGGNLWINTTDATRRLFKIDSSLNATLVRSGNPSQYRELVGVGDDLWVRNISTRAFHKINTTTGVPDTNPIFSYYPIRHDRTLINETVFTARQNLFYYNGFVYFMTYVNTANLIYKLNLQGGIVSVTEFASRSDLRYQTTYASFSDGEIYFLTGGVPEYDIQKVDVESGTIEYVGKIPRVPILDVMYLDGFSYVNANTRDFLSSFYDVPINKEDIENLLSYDRSDYREALQSLGIDNATAGGVSNPIPTGTDIAIIRSATGARILKNLTEDTAVNTGETWTALNFS